MNKDEDVLLLIGSPKGSSSTSTSIGNYLTSRLEEFGLSIKKTYIYKLIRKEDGHKKLLSKINNADLIILVFPLYIDCLPAGVIKALELIANHRKSLKNPKKTGFVVLINCGFPEAEQNNTAVEICKIFARDVGFEWKGALALGMGGGIGSRSLEELGGMVKNLKQGLILAAQDLAEGGDISEETIKLVAKQSIPITLYVKMANLGWNRQAKKFGARKKIRAKPYS